MAPSLRRSTTVVAIEAYARDIGKWMRFWMVSIALLGLPLLLTRNRPRRKAKWTMRRVSCWDPTAQLHLVAVATSEVVKDDPLADMSKPLQAKKRLPEPEWIPATFEPLTEAVISGLQRCEFLCEQFDSLGHTCYGRGVVAVQYRRFLAAVAVNATTDDWSRTPDGVIGFESLRLGNDSDSGNGSSELHSEPDGSFPDLIDGHVEFFDLPEHLPLGTSPGQLAGDLTRGARAAVYGANVIHAPVPPLMHVFVSEILHPFFVFQLLAVLLWVAEDYYMYASAIFIISVGGAFMEAHEVVSNSKRLSELAKGASNDADASLVPGDSVCVTPETVIPADCSLVNGSVLVDESSLTGESVPVRKAAWTLRRNGEVPWHSESVALHAGTRVLSAAPGSRAVVTRTGCGTRRGVLIRDMLLGPSSAAGWSGGRGARTDSLGIPLEVYAVLIALFILGIVGSSWAVWMFVTRYKLSVWNALVESLDLITIAVPPALPATVTFGLAFALARLHRARILCVRVAAVPIAGHTDVICFDKTGTLTERGLVAHALYELSHGANAKVLRRVLCDATNVSTDLSQDLRRALACCHSLSTVNGKLAGDEIDVSLFSLSGYRLLDAGLSHEASDVIFRVHTEGFGEAPENVEVVRLFDFQPELARQSSIARITVDGARRCVVFVKGAPEVVTSICRSNSVPSNLAAVLDEHMSEGRRVLALASRGVDTSRAIGEEPATMSRAEAESQLVFLGLVVLENPLKEDSKRVMESLMSEAGLETKLVTGDHSLTSISIARQCGMLPPVGYGRVFEVKSRQATPPRARQLVDEDFGFVDTSLPNASQAMHTLDDLMYMNVTTTAAPSTTTKRDTILIVATGDVLATMPRRSRLSEFVLRAGVVFARMSPGQKTELMQRLHEDAGHNVLMCGDGANDVGALRAADTGVAILHSAVPQGRNDGAAVEEGWSTSTHTSSSEEDIETGLLAGRESGDLIRRKPRTWLRRRRRQQMNANKHMGEFEKEGQTASLAAPFTSRGSSVACTTHIVRQGRAAAATSLAAFQYMFLYSLIQFASVSLLYSQGALVADGQFLYVDLFVVMPLAVLVSRSDAASSLNSRRPADSIFHWRTVANTCALAVWNIGLQYVAFRYILPDAPVMKVTPGAAGELQTRVVVVTGMFAFVNMQYVATAIALNLGAPHRRPLRFNYGACTWIIACLASNLWILLAPASNAPLVTRWLETVEMDKHLRMTLCSLSVLNSVGTILLGGLAAM